MARKSINRTNIKKIIYLSIGFIAIGVLVILGSNWYAIAALYRPTPTPKPVLLNYTNRVHGFSLKFPQYWADVEPNSLTEIATYIVRFTEPDNEGTGNPMSITVMAVDLPPELENETLENYVEQSVKTVSESAANFSLVGITDTTISSLPAKIITWSMGNDDYSVMNDQAIFMKGPRVYIISSSIMSEDHDRAIPPFQLITSTFQFKSATIPSNTPASTP